MPVIDVERIRVAAERVAYDALAQEELFARLTHVPGDTSVRRRELLATALLLTDAMAPHAYAAAREAMATLSVDDEIELFQSKGHDAVCLTLFGGPIGIEFIGAQLGAFDRGGLLAVLGHEIGHSVAHCGHPRYAWASAASLAGNTATKRAYSMAAELTADRFGLLACRDIEAVLRMEMQLAAGSSATGVRFDTSSYLKQCCAVAEEILARGATAMGTTHPQHYVRGYAEWLFSETDLYKSITGAGPGSRSIQEVDATLQALLGLHARPPPGPAPYFPAVGRALQPRIEEGTSDPLEDERRDLLARFDELERLSRRD